MGKYSGQSWTANFFKCAGNTSHPHWASWSSIGTSLIFINLSSPEFSNLKTSWQGEAAARAFTKTKILRLSEGLSRSATVCGPVDIVQFLTSSI